MTNTIKTILLTSIFFFASFSNGLFSQCQSASFSGTMQLGESTFCIDANTPIPTTYLWSTIDFSYQNNAVLEENDTLLFYLTDENGPVNGEIISSSGAGVDMPLPIGSIQVFEPYRLYAVVGDKDGNGGIALTDSCVSVSSGRQVLFYDTQQVFAVGGTILIDMPCEGELTLDASLAIINGMEPEEFFYIWNGVVGESLFTISEPGEYVVEIGSINGACSVFESYSVSPHVPIGFNLDPVDSISCITSSTLLKLTPAGSLGAWTGQWLDQSNNIIAVDVLEVLVNTPGTYSFEVTFLDGNSENCTEVYDVFVPASAEGCVLIQGVVGRDQNDDCAYDTGEPGLANRLLLFENAIAGRFALTDADGNYELFYPANTDATVSIVSQHFLYENCQENWMINGAAVGETIFSFFVQATVDDCALLDVQLNLIGANRRCFDVPFNVSYCNSGNLPAEDTYIVVTLDEHCILNSAELPFTDLGENQYQFDIGNVAEDDCGNFRIFTTLSCDATLGETVCSEANIYPGIPCPGPSTSWSEASVSVTGTCDGTENKFVISNVGSQDMIDVSNYIVIEDGIMIQTPADFILNSGEINELNFAANGKTYRVEAVQVPDHPGMSMPSFTIEGCGGFGSMGFVNQFAQNDGDPFVDIECREVVGAYDPNDKTAFPSGYGEEHFIKEDQEIEYLIRFQNTGTDTAFTVMVQDVIDPSLDFTTFKPKRSSHDYEVVFLENDTIQFIFDNILLPDSTTNLLESNGYIRFTISPEVDVVLGTVIKNEAAIFFDFNEPIITNDVFHTIGEAFVLTDIHTISSISPEVVIYPNPTNGEWFLSVKNVTEYGKLNLVLTDALGRSIIEAAVGNEGVRVDISSFNSGIYFWKLENGEGVVSSGRLVRM